MKAMRFVLALAVLLTATACGVKSDLTRPDHQQPQKGEKDPSKPPSPIGR